MRSSLRNVVIALLVLMSPPVAAEDTKEDIQELVLEETFMLFRLVHICETNMDNRWTLLQFYRMRRALVMTEQPVKPLQTWKIDEPPIDEKGEILQVVCEEAAQSHHDSIELMVKMYVKSK